ncbi:MAG: ArsA family ATPase [Bacillota bacterium]|nr:ArsA family ATPase [Bacillota bacterium]
MGKILFFGGKGGVGKTSCSSAYALQRSREGKKVLLISTDPAHSVSDLFECKIGNEIIKIRENLYATEIDAEQEAEKYIEGIRKNISKIYSQVVIAEINKQLDSAKLSPGTYEAALFDCIVKIINETSESYDYIIFDTAPTGHTVRLLTLPDLLDSWVNSLLRKRKETVRYKEMREQTKVGTSKDEIIEILTRRQESLKKAKSILLDSGKLGFFFVLNAEKLAIDETRKAADILNKYNIPIAGFVVNRILPEQQSDEFWRKKKEIEAKHLQEIEEAFRYARIYKIPLLVSDMNRNEVESIAENFI